MKPLKMKLYKAEVNGQWLPVWAESLETALEAAELTYGKKAVGRVRPEVTQ